MEDIAQKEEEQLCRHNRLPRNCYLCYLHRNDDKIQHTKTILDTLHESLSELKIRIAKLEQYKLLQDDMNTASRDKYIFHDDILNKHERDIQKLFEHDLEQAKQMKDLTLRICDIETMNQKAIDANPIKDIYERFEKIDEGIVSLKDWMSEHEKEGSVYGYKQPAVGDG